MSGLRIETTLGQIALDIRWPQIEMQTTLPHMEMTTDQPAVIIDIDWPKVDLDMTDAFAEIGLKRSLDLYRDHGSLGQQKALDAIADMARLGDMLAKIEEDGDPAALIGRTAWPPQVKEINVKLIPTSPIKVSAHGHLDISWADGSVDLNLSPGEIDYRAHMGEVSVMMAVYPKVEIQSVGKMYSTWA